MIKPAFIDLSHHNVVTESLKPARRAGILGVIHKATESTGFVDSKLDNRHWLAKDAGLLWGVYHFIRPGNVGAQVDHFLNATAEYSDEDTLYALDWEDRGVSLDDAVKFMIALERATERSPVLYSGHVLKEALHGQPDRRLSQYRLWLAHYTSSSEPELPPGWDKYWGWQYTENGIVAGVVPPTDLNAFDGTENELIVGWSGGPPAPPVAELEITVIVPPGVKVNIREES